MGSPDVATLPKCMWSHFHWISPVPDLLLRGGAPKSVSSNFRVPQSGAKLKILIENSK